LSEITQEMTGDPLVPDTMRFSEDRSGDVSTDASANGSMAESQDLLPTGPQGVPTLPAELNIRPPPKRLGKLISTADSFVAGLTLPIDQSRTSWGRQPTNTLVYDNPSDTRIPKTAFIIFWYSSSAGSTTVDELSQEGKDWTSLSNLHAGIFTCASAGISINGKHLRQKDSKGRALFGNLRNGDIIQAFNSTTSVECLKFKCEFYHGSAKEIRPPGEQFIIQVGGRLAAE
jgi:hypothetical protein